MSPLSEVQVWSIKVPHSVCLRGCWGWLKKSFDSVVSTEIYLHV